MKSCINTITTFSTIEDSKVQIVSSKYIIPLPFNSSRLVQSSKSPQIVSILEENITNTTHQIQIIKENVFKTKPLKRIIKIHSVFPWENSNLSIANVLEKIFFKKKRYCFQVLKQFILFPEESQSSISTHMNYNPLIFNDEVFHTLIKILETKTIENIIWGFINLRMMPYLKAASKIEQKVIKIQDKVIHLQKKFSFDLIKNTSIDFISSISKQSRCFYINNNLLSENKQVQYVIEQEKMKQKQKRNQLSSNLVHQKVVPLLKIIPESYNTQSTTRIYTRQEYEKKYGQTTSTKNNYQPKAERIQTRDYDKKRIQQPVPSMIHQFENKIRVQKQKSQDSKNSIKKYNIIHYHQRPRQLIQSTVKHEENQHFNGGCMNSCALCIEKCCCNQHEQIHSYKNHRTSEIRSCLCINVNYKPDKINQTAITDRIKNMNYNNPNLSSSKLIYSQSENYELSQLSSRIQYLKFLRNIVKEQQQQSTI